MFQPRGWHAAIFGLAAGGLAFVVSTNAAQPAASSNPPAPTAVDADLCAGGVDGAVRVQLVPTKSRSDGKGERFTLAVETTNQTERDVQVRRRVRIVDPAGEAALAERTVGEGHAKVGYTAADELELPKLEDGYYRVVATADSEEGRSEDQLYVRVKEGRQMPISFEEWYLESGVADVGGPDTPPASKEVR